MKQYDSDLEMIAYEIYGEDIEEQKEIIKQQNNDLKQKEKELKQKEDIINNLMKIFK